MIELTKEIKEDWLVALKSGNYTQLQNEYTEGSTGEDLLEGATKHCCLAVLDVILRKKKLSTSWKKYIIPLTKLIDINDEEDKSFTPDYSNVIPFIEQLPIKEQ